MVSPSRSDKFFCILCQARAHTVRLFWGFITIRGRGICFYLILAGTAIMLLFEGQYKSLRDEPAHDRFGGHQLAKFFIFLNALPGCRKRRLHAHRVRTYSLCRSTDRLQNDRGNQERALGADSALTTFTPSSRPVHVAGFWRRKVGEY